MVSFFFLAQIPSLNPLVVEKHFSNKQALNVVLRNKGSSLQSNCMNKSVNHVSLLKTDVILQPCTLASLIPRLLEGGLGMRLLSCILDHCAP